MLCHDTQAVRIPRASAVSQALRAIQEDLGEGSADDSNGWPVGQGGIRILLANTRALRQRAYALAYRVYRESGYVRPDSFGRVVSPHDADPETFTLLAEDERGEAAGTITLYFDGPLGLPCDAIFAPELEALRARGRRPVEVARLAIAPDYQRSKEVLHGMINFLFVYAKRVMRYSDFVIEVNPRHAGFYRRFLNFGTLGEERPCPRVEGAPAVLLALDLDVYLEAMTRRENGTLAESGLARTLFARFLPLDVEASLAAFLACQQRPMTSQEARHFGLASPREMVSRWIAQGLKDKSSTRAVEPLRG